MKWQTQSIKTDKWGDRSYQRFWRFFDFLLSPENLGSAYGFFVFSNALRHKNSVMLNNHVMANPAPVILHVILNNHVMVNHLHVTLNSFQGLSLIKSLNRKETKPKLMSTTMVNNKLLHALEQIQDVSGSYFVALVQYLNCTKDPEMNSG